MTTVRVARPLNIPMPTFGNDPHIVFVAVVRLFDRMYASIGDAEAFANTWFTDVVGTAVCRV